MGLAIFESVIINDALIELEAEGKKYEGLYVEMNNAPERKYVKDKAALIAGLKKKVDRVRIDTAKAYKVEVENQAQAIQSRLDDANAPFQVLIDEYNIERKKILDAKKANEAALELRAKIEDDHEMALLMNKTWAYDREQELKAQVEAEAARMLEREVYAAEQVKKAEQRQIEQQQQDEQQKTKEENARLANKEHVRKVNRAILDALEENDIGTGTAKLIITLAVKGLLPQLTINY